MFPEILDLRIERAKKEQKALPVCQKAQQEMRKTTTQFYDNHRQTTHEERKNGIAIVETERERIRSYCFACRTTYQLYWEQAFPLGVCRFVIQRV